MAVERIRLRQDALEGRVAVITGGAKGIGREIACALSVLGARVIIAASTEDGPETERIITEAQLKGFFVRTDLSDSAAVATLSAAVTQGFGGVDILVNNAATYSVASTEDTDVELWDRVLAQNLRAAFLACRAFLPGMLKRRSGTIVNVVFTDVAPHLAASIASTHGLIGLTQALASEVADRGVSIVAFAPGVADTEETTEMAESLASLGSVQAFMKTSYHPAYDGLIPPDHAAAALAYLVAALAPDYHGATVNSYQLLERAGFIESARGVSERSVHMPDPGAGGEKGRTVFLEVALSERLQQIIDATEAEFRRLPAHLQAIARQAFETKTGQSISRWQRAAADLTALLENTRTSDSPPKQIYYSSHPNLEGSLRRLIAYYHDSPMEMASLTDDASILRDVAFFSPQRQTSLRFLLRALERVLLPVAAVLSGASRRAEGANGDDSE